MTDLTQGPKQSVFNSRADDAALALKDQLGREISAQTGQQVVLPPTPVAVGVDGQPVGQLPPEGSYARDQILQQRVADAQQAGYTPSAAHVQATDPSAQTPQAGQPAPPPQQTPEVSQRAESRIQDFVTKLRSKDEELAGIRQEQSGQATTIQQLQQQLQARDQQFNKLLTEHMDQLDPETKQQVLSNARIAEAVAASEARIIGALQPQLKTIRENDVQREKADLSTMFPERYDPIKHDHLIDAMRTANPQTSVRMAFQAILTPEEMTAGGGSRAIVPPPTVPPGNGPVSPRFMPQQASQVDPIEQMVADAAKAAELARSTDPKDQQAATALWHKNLTERLGMAAPGT